MRPLLAVLLGLVLVLPVARVASAQVADPTPLAFNDAAEEQRFHALVVELRCVMCQNQSLADSNAQIAVDLRREVLALMREGRSDAEVKAYLVERYGEFVLYRPEVASRTWLLWFGPALVLVLGGLGVLWAVRRHAGRDPVPLDDEQEW
ncbi:cytochrome c-type biogenesis protein CcmH [Lysobacter sp. SG-8]|uniref:Cytochrome c-type biogenesis protein n=1 Tax=Marilutibacter penaei TaxID=2759900 RepID=A0A7W3YDV2_9GAMM|nr:cytochrome c-type biogenesis protein [Lysobacter penaei]MBB1087541.1 cytochrome c-type biogenesis protein CcmH [Lysobacter penaei]